MKVLITGAAGFIGSHIAEQFDDVVGVDDLSTGRAENFPGELIVDDITYGLPNVHADVIYHCAASYHDRTNWERDARVNVLGTIAAVRLAQDTGARLVYMQTSLCYGPTPDSPVTPDAPLEPVGSYAVSKTAAEHYIRDSGIDWVSLRLANIYGPRNLSGPVPAFYQRLTIGKPCTVVDSRRDFVFVDDLVRVAVRAAERGSGVYNISSGSDVAILDIWRAVRSALDVDAPEPEITPRGADDVATILLDSSETQRQFVWQPTTPLAEGIGRAVAWYREHGVERTFTHLKEGS